jgi:spermidine synthase
LEEVPINRLKPAKFMPRRNSFLTGVFLITFAVLVFQTVQTRILSVIAWYYLAFFAISVAMLGMTAGAVWVYLKQTRLTPDRLSMTLSDSALLTAVAMPLAVMVQFSLITTLTPSVVSLFAGILLMMAMTMPYVFAGITVSLALTRSPFPVSQVYGVDLLGAALGCAAVVGILDFFDGPSAILLAGLLCGLAAHAFARAGTPAEQAVLARRARWQRPLNVTLVLFVLIKLNLSLPFGFKPVLVKDQFEHSWATRTERWNSYSRIVAYPPAESRPFLWGPSPLVDQTRIVQQAWLNIDGEAGTPMNHFDGTSASIDFLRYDLVNLAYHLPGIVKSAVIGVGGGRDVMSAHLFGVRDITAVELNPIFIHLLTNDPFYAPYANLQAIGGLKLHVDDARSWFGATRESFDLIQMSMIDTWAATGAGAFSLSENGLYTLEAWRAFVSRLSVDGVFTVSRWYSQGDVDESGRMIALALAAMMDAGVTDPRRHVFVARTDRIATLVLSRSPLSANRLAILREETERLGFPVLVEPDRNPESVTLRTMVAAKDITTLDAAAQTTFLDLTVPTDRRPFFFNQLRFRDIPRAVGKLFRGELGAGVLRGNLTASITLVLILIIALAAVVCTILLPLRSVAKAAPRPLIVPGTLYFSLIGLGFMLAEISMLQYFSVFLGHPIYALSVCLFSLILASGLGSLASARLQLDTVRRVAVWGVIVGGYLLLAQWALSHLFEATTAQPVAVRIVVSLVVVMPVGFLMGFAFPTGMALVNRVDSNPAPWFWGINGATGVLASVLAVMISMAFGINVTMFAAGLCYLAVIPTARALLLISSAVKAPGGSPAAGLPRSTTSDVDVIAS